MTAGPADRTTARTRLPPRVIAAVLASLVLLPALAWRYGRRPRSMDEVA